MDERAGGATCSEGARALLTVRGPHGPVLRGEAVPCDAAVGSKGDPHRAAVGVHGRWRNVSAEPAGERDRTFNNSYYFSVLQLWKMQVGV